VQRFPRAFVETSMVSVESLSPNDIEDILREVDPKRQFSETEISSVTKSLNDTLADYALSEEERDIEPTARELNKQIDALESALKRLKMALPKPGQRSLFNFLVRAGEVYAKTNGPHPNVKHRRYMLGTRDAT